MLILHLLATRVKQVHKAKESREGRVGGDGAGSCWQRKRLDLRGVYSLHAGREDKTVFKRGKAEFAWLCTQLGQVWSPFLLRPWGLISYSRAGGGPGGGACRKLACGQLWSPGEAKLGVRDHMVSSRRNQGLGVRRFERDGEAWPRVLVLRETELRLAWRAWRGRRPWWAGLWWRRGWMERVSCSCCSSFSTLKIPPCPRAVARSGLAMLLLLGLCLGLPLFSESQEVARSWDDASEQVSRRAVGTAALSLPSVSLAVRLLDGLELTHGMQVREASPPSGLHHPFSQSSGGELSFSSFGHLCFFWVILSACPIPVCRRVVHGTSKSFRIKCSCWLPLSTRFLSVLANFWDRLLPSSSLQVSVLDLWGG